MGIDPQKSRDAAAAARAAQNQHDRVAKIVELAEKAQRWEQSQQRIEHFKDEFQQRMEASAQWNASQGEARASATLKHLKGADYEAAKQAAQELAQSYETDSSTSAYAKETKFYTKHETYYGAAGVTPTGHRGYDPEWEVSLDVYFDSKYRPR